MTKFCKGCKHYEFLDMVMGAPFSHACFRFKDAVGLPKDCYDARDALGVCGPEAKGFEAVLQKLEKRSWFSKWWYPKGPTKDYE